MLGQPIFPGENGVDQLVEIIKILGTPTKEQIQAMNPNYTEFRFPIIKPCPWNKVSAHSFSFLTLLDCCSWRMSERAEKLGDEVWLD